METIATILNYVLGISHCLFTRAVGCPRNLGIL